MKTIRKTAVSIFLVNLAGVFFLGGGGLFEFFTLQDKYNISTGVYYDTEKTRL
jgi:capsular polysaccharide biosynthesis protein